MKNNVYGVDLDEKAITIAELNVYLSLLTLSKKQKTIETHESLLPELKGNIKIGNSLIDDKLLAQDKSNILRVFTFNKLRSFSAEPSVLSNMYFTIYFGVQ